MPIVLNIPKTQLIVEKKKQNKLSSILSKLRI